MDELKYCERCGKPIPHNHRNRPGRYCSRACYNAAGRPLRKATTQGTRMRTAPEHPIAPPSGGVAACRIILYEKIGPGTHPCNWCQEPVTWMPGAGIVKGALLVDHLDWDQQNNSPGNLVPSCHRCNSHRTKSGGRAPIIEGELTVERGGVRTRAINRFCLICGTKFTVALSQVKVGRGLFCSRSCARKQPHRD